MTAQNCGNFGVTILRCGCLLARLATTPRLFDISAPLVFEAYRDHRKTRHRILLNRPISRATSAHGHSRASKPPNRQVGSSPRSPSCSIALSKRSSRPHCDLSGNEALTILRSIRVSAPSDRAALAVSPAG
jgi:hypothetical protein